ncbi:hypothetical protein KR054_002529, partial [Drosophila jambulina]
RPSRVSISEGSEFSNGPTPRHSLLSARYKQSFAYLTLRTRMPAVMHQVTQRLITDGPSLQEKYGEEVHKDIRQILDALDRLKMELNRDRNFQLFHGNEPDKIEWNAFLSELPYPKKCYFRACWLHAECYLYRRMYSFFENSRFLTGYDCFFHLKREDMLISTEAMKTLARATQGLPGGFENFRKLMIINLWSNHFSGQLSAYKFKEDENPGDIDVLFKVAQIDRSILVDDTWPIWKCLNKNRNKETNIILDYICDNAGFEFFTDMIFLAFLVDNKLADHVRLHVKAIPWYISDTTAPDVEWTVNHLLNHEDEFLSKMGRKWERLMSTEKIVIAPISHFWTGPQPYFAMVELDLELYRLLTTARLAIFKGDLNYRKLLGDFIWDSTEEFITCLRGFRPTNICAIRTVKCEVMCGLPEGRADALHRRDHRWIFGGNYGLIQYTDS